MRRFLAALVLLSLPATAPAQQPPTVTFPPGPVKFNIPGPFTVEQGVGYVTFRWDGPSPDPTPDPPPPTPKPTPVVTTQNPLWVIGVYDKSTPLAPIHQALKDSKTIGPALKALNAEWRMYDKSDPRLKLWAAFVPPAPGLLIIENKPDGASKFDATPLADEPGVIVSIRAARGR